MKKTFQTIVVLLTFACVAMVSCTDDLGMVGVRPSEVICFTASLDNLNTSGKTRSTSGHLAIEEEEWRLEGVAIDSRGGLTTALEGSAGVIGIADNALEFSFRGDELTSVGTPVYWKDINKADFDIYAYAPYDVTTVDAANKTITFTVENEVASQKDVVVASRNVSVDDFNQTVPLTFNHILTAVRFKLGFDAEVKSITVSGVSNQGKYSMTDGTWASLSTVDTPSYSITSTESGNELLMIPQTLASGAKVTLECTDGTKLEASLDGQEWKPGKLITYTLYEGSAPTTIYFDLEAGNVELGKKADADDVTINQTLVEGDIIYKGSVYVAGKSKTVIGKHLPTNRYYVYQSSTDERYNAQKTGYEDEANFNAKTNCRIPDYASVPHPTDETKLWRDYIVNNQDVDAIIESWYINEYSKTAGKVGRTGTGYRITAHGVDNTSYDLVIDDIYSTYQEANKARKTGGITFSPASTNNCVLTITTIGDNRLGNIHYYNEPNAFVKSSNTATKIENLGIETYIQTKNTSNGSQIIFEGTGTLTVADVIANKGHASGWNVDGFFGNYYCAAIGGNDNGDEEECMGIVINSGVLFAGSTASENCSAIGGGGNGFGEVTINGGTVTAVAATTGTAIGGGIGYSSHGGEGRVYINGGNVYAYNLDNHRNIPSSAIGGAGSSNSTGNLGVVEITGGYVYAYSALGTAIGGGSSEKNVGGDAKVVITGGQVIAVSDAGAGIGGGSAYTKAENGNTENFNGGTAIINISGNPIIRTGSIGGGNTGATNGKIGSANITIGGGDIQAQFVMAAGAKDAPSFTMNGGTIRNSYVDDEEYIHIKKQGGAVYLEDGTFTMNDGIIKNCSAEQGGAICIAGTYDETEETYKASFTMTGGIIEQCTSKTDGGAVYLKGGNMTLTGGTISDNLAQGGNGGGLYLMEGNFEMSNAEIIENSAMYRNNEGGNGGGVYISSSIDARNDVSVNIVSGTIADNTADRQGGGVCVVMPEVKVDNKPLLADVSVGSSSGGPDISGNNALMKGGGLYVEGAGDFDAVPTDGSFYGFNTCVTINDGKINGNSTTSYVPNDDIVNEKGIVTLNGGDVPYVTVTFYGNGGKTSDGQEMYVQRLVTSTNNILILPVFTHIQNTLVNVKKWNTRADGQGEDYEYTNGSSINLSESLVLYAVWGE